MNSDQHHQPPPHQRPPAHLDILAVVEPGNTLHQVRRWVVAEVRADVAYTQSSSAGHQVTRMLVGTLV